MKAIHAKTFWPKKLNFKIRGGLTACPFQFDNQFPPKDVRSKNLSWVASVANSEGSGENKCTIGRPTVHWLIKQIKFWAVNCKKWIEYYINRIDYQQGLFEKSGLRHILIDKCCLQRILFHELLEKNAQIFCVPAHFFHKIISWIFVRCIWYQISYSVYQLLGSENNSNSSTQWSQWQNLYNASIKNTSRNNPSVKSNLARNESRKYFLRYSVL